MNQKYKKLPKVGRRVAGGPLGGDELLFRLEAVDERGVDVVAVGVALQRPFANFFEKFIHHK